MPGEFKIDYRVEFSETDMAGIVHFSNFFRYMERVEHAFFRSLGHSIVSHDFDPPVGWPRVHAECDYKRPLRFEDEFEIHLAVEELKSRSIKYLIRFGKKLADGSLEEVAVGRLVTVCVTRDADGKMSPTLIPDEIRRRIEAS